MKATNPADTERVNDPGEKDPLLETVEQVANETLDPEVIPLVV